jgi:hypothetical protein
MESECWVSLFRALHLKLQNDAMLPAAGSIDQRASSQCLPVAALAVSKARLMVWRSAPAQTSQRFATHLPPILLLLLLLLLWLLVVRTLALLWLAVAGGWSSLWMVSRKAW